MKKILFLLACLSIFERGHSESLVTLGAGWRQDYLNWNIAGFHNEPNILSELKWKDLQMWEISGSYIGTFCDWIYLRAKGDYAQIYSGRNTDADFLGNNRTELFSLSHNSANKGEAFDLSIGIGIPFHFFCDQLFIAPLIGYSQMEQHLSLHNGFQVFDAFSGFRGHFQGLHSNYRARWMCGFIGFDSAYEINCDSYVAFNAEYYFSRYHGSGHWNLRTDLLDDFKHRGWAHGYSVYAGAFYRIWYQAFLGLGVNWRYFHLRHGTDTTEFLDPIFDSNGNIVAEEILGGSTRLNEVNWGSFRVIASLTYEF